MSIRTQHVTHRSTHLRRALALAALTLLAACSEPPAASSEFNLGTGTWRFDALEDGDQVNLVRGAQGGWHVWVAVQARGVENGDLLRIETQIADESMPAQSVELTPNFDPANSEGYRNYLGWPSMLDRPECLVGKLLRITASLEMQGETFTDERMVLVGEGADPPGECVQ